MPNENSYEVALQKSNAIREGLAKTPEKFTMLTGDRPTGRLHLGHYIGTLKGRVELQNMGAKTNVLIADYQVITDRDGVGRRGHILRADAHQGRVRLQDHGRRQRVR